MTIAMLLCSAVLSLGALQEQDFRLLEAATPQSFSKPIPFAGLAVFELEIDATGTVAKNSLVIGQPPFIERSEVALKKWTFTRIPADRTPMHASAIFLYKPQTIVADEPSAFELPPLCETNGDETPLPVRVVMPGYPFDAAMGEGSVVIQATVDPLGDVTDVQVIRPLPSVTDSAVEAVRNWKFAPTPATGKTSPRIAIAVISFQRPLYPPQPSPPCPQNPPSSKK